MTAPFIQLFKGDNNIYGCQTKKELELASLHLLNTFNDSIVIDSEQNMFSIKKANKVGWGTPFFGYSLLTKGRLVKINFDIESTQQLSIQEIKQLLISKVTGKPTGNFTKTIFGSVDKLVKKINEKEKIKDLIELFLYDD